MSAERESLGEAGGGQDESQVVLIALGPFEFTLLLCFSSSLPYSQTPCFRVLREVLRPTTVLLCLRLAVDTGSAFLALWVSL